MKTNHCGENMLKISKYYIPYIWAVLMAALLLYVQANMDLALPDYLSRIVNVGLQQGGVQDPYPETIRQTTFSTLENIIDPEYRDRLNAGYSILKDGILEINQEGRENFLDNNFRSDFALSFLFASGLQNPESAALPEGMGSLDFQFDPQTFLSLPAESRTALLSQIKAQISSQLNPEMIQQAAIQAVRSEYEGQSIDPIPLQNRYILNTGFMMIVITLISALATVLVSLIGARVAAGVARALRSDLFKKIEGFSAAEFDHFSTASLITRNTNDITQVQTVIYHIIRIVLYAPILGVGGVIRAVGRAPSMAWIIGLAVLLLFGLILIILTVAMPKFKVIQSMVDRLNKVAREQLSGLLVVRAFNRQAFETERFDEANKDLTKTNLFVIRVMVLMMPLVMLIMNLLSIAIIWIGAEQVAASAMQVGDMMAFLQYAMQIVMSFLMLSMMMIFLPRAAVSADRIAEVLSTKGSIIDSPNPKSLKKNVSGELVFQDVSFRYPGADDLALEKISFTAKPGETTAIIGSTGSGKTSLMNLIPRFYDVSSGSVLLDGVDIRALSLKNLRSQIGYVPQKSLLFAGTIESNISYGDDDASQETIQSAAETAQALDFIQEREEGFDSAISQGGVNVSGGQKQRLAIARALIKKFPILLFDDSFSALDFKTDSELRAALEKKNADAVKIVVAQRVSTIMKAEQILVLDEGKLVGKGNHKTLMETCETYKEIVLSQLSAKELNR
jgi:ATP-binding cassette subfamily B multidrug efflux pump